MFSINNSELFYILFFTFVQIMEEGFVAILNDMEFDSIHDALECVTVFTTISDTHTKTINHPNFVDEKKYHVFLVINIHFLFFFVFLAETKKQMAHISNTKIETSSNENMEATQTILQSNIQCRDT